MNLDKEEILNFESHAHESWNDRGPYKILHKLNPLRLKFITDRITLDGITVLDIGCGGGLLAEEMAKKGASVTGIDASKKTISVAKKHAQESKLKIDYQCITLNEYIEKTRKKFDCVICYELIEHVPDPQKLLEDINIISMRGNIDTRINKLKNGEFDAIILSLAGLKMLNLEKEAKEIFSDEQMLPAIGQGVIALQCRLDDQKILDILKNINDQESYFCVQAERALLEVLEGDCDTAVGGLAKLWNNKIILKSELFSNDGSKKFVAEGSGNFKEAGKIGYKVGKELLKKAGPDFKTQGS